MGHSRVSDFRARARLLRDEAKRTIHAVLRDDMERMAGHYDRLADEIERGFRRGVRTGRPRGLRDAAELAGEGSSEKPAAPPREDSWT